MKDLYAWVPWFGELCEKIAEGGESELARGARKVRWTDDGNVSPLLEHGAANIDPFSFLYTLATGCRHAEGRERLCASVGEVFSLEAEMPTEVDDAFVAPNVVTSNTLFHQQGQGDPSLLWRLFLSAREGTHAVDAADFDAALAIGGVAFPKLTQALFLVNPSEFIPYDVRTRKLLADDDPGANNWAGYRSVVGRFRDAFPGCGFPEGNLLAWLLRRRRKLSLVSAAYLISTNVYHDNKSRWDEFVEANAVWTGGPGGNVGWRDYTEGTTPRQTYPLESPEPGDLILVHHGRQGKGIGVVHRNGYREGLSENARLDVVWVNRSEAERDSFSGHTAFTRAHDIANAFFECDAYAGTFQRLAVLGYKGEPFGNDKPNGLSREAVLRAIDEFEELGREGFLKRYGYRVSHHLWIVHEGRRYDMKAVWAAAQVEPGTLLPVPMPKPNHSRNVVQPQLEKLGFDVEEAPPIPVPSAPAVASRNQILYGPPGTGKTWHTVNVALSIVDGGSGEHDLERFKELRFDARTGEGHVALVTFHQNFAYEDFIANSFRRHQQRYAVVSHGPGSAMASIGDAPVFSTMPDIALRAGGKVRLILDAKWKRVDATTEDLKHSIQQADVYQLYAYAKRYRCEAVALVYPRNESFRRPLRYRFFDGVRLLAIPFDVTQPQSSVARAIGELEREADDSLL